MQKSTATSGQLRARKAVSLLLAMTLTLGLTPAAAFAEAEEALEGSESPAVESPENAAPEETGDEHTNADGEVTSTTEGDDATDADGDETAGLSEGEGSSSQADGAGGMEPEPDAVEKPAVSQEEEPADDPAQEQPAEETETEDGFTLQADENTEQGTWGGCSWSLDSEGTLTIRPTNGERGVLTDSHSFNDNAGIRSVVFEDGVVLPRSCYMLFRGCPNLRSIDYSGVDASAVRTMTGMFASLSSLESVDLSGLDTSSVWTMGSMFDGCSSLVSVNLSGLDTSSVINMGHLFEECSSLESVDLSGLNTSSVTDMSGMFNQCSSLTSLNLSGLDTSSVTDMSSMFWGCSSLASLNLSGLDTSSVTNMSSMFYGCSSLASLDLSGLNASSVTNMREMFDGCSSLTSLDVSGFKASSATDMRSMFYGCSSLESLDLSGLDTSSAHLMSDMFCLCSSLKSLDLSGLDTSSATDMSGMFNQCSSLTSLNLSGLDTSSATDMAGMFSFCESLTSLDLSGFDTSKVTDMGAMFHGCSSLTSLDLSGLDTSSVTDMSSMFWGCSSLASLDVSGFDTSSAVDMDGMFYNCLSLTSLDVSGFGTSSVTDIGWMFYHCTNLESLDLSGFDTSSVTDMRELFKYCSSLESLDLSGFDTSSVTDMRDVFSECSSLQSVTLGSGFSFTGDGSTSCKLPDLGAEYSYTGKWTKDGSVGYKASELASAYDGSEAMRGTYHWQEKRDPVITLSDKTATYTGEAIAIGEADVGGSGGEVTYAYYADSACTQQLAAADIRDAGTYYAVATVAATDDYWPATSAAAQLVIGKAASVVTLSDKSAAYNGKVVKIGDASVEGSSGDVSYVYYSDSACTSEVDATDVVDAGTYYVMATVAADANHDGATSEVAKLVISKAASTVALKDKSATYTGKAVKMSGAVVKGSTGKVTYKYFADAECTKEVAASKVVNAKTYYVKATVAADANYNGATSEAAKLVIKKAASAITLKDKTATYSSKAIAIGKAAVKGSAGKVTYRYYADSKCTKEVAASKVVNAKTYYVKATVAADTNHKGATSKAAKLVVKPAKISSAKLSAESAAYTGKAIKPKASATAKGGAGKISVPASGMKVTYKANKAVGTATVTVKGKGNFAGTKKLTFKINPPKARLTHVAGFVPVVDGKKIAKGGILARWAKAAGSPGWYEVQVSTSKTFKGGWTATKAFTAAMLKQYGTEFEGFVPKKNVRYYVHVRAVKKVSGVTLRGAWSDVRSAVSK